MSISIDLARRILEACKQRARELRSPVSITIVDASGHLVLFERMMAPYGWATGNISIAKATTSVMFNQPTEGVAQWASAIPGFAASLSAMTDGKFIMAAGGWPIRVNDVTIGGIGISGGNAPGRDDDIARAGLNVVTPPPVATPMTYYAPPQAQQPQAPYTPPQAQQPPVAAYQTVSTPAQSNNNASAEHSSSAPIADEYSEDSTKNIAGTENLSSEENVGNPSLEEPPSSSEGLQEGLGDQS